MKKIMKILLPIVVIDIFTGALFILNEFIGYRNNIDSIYFLGAAKLVWMAAPLLLRIKARVIAEWHIILAWLITFFAFGRQGKIAFAIVSLAIAGIICLGFRKEKDEDKLSLFCVYLLLCGVLFILLGLFVMESQDDFLLLIFILIIGFFRTVGLFIVNLFVSLFRKHLPALRYNKYITASVLLILCSAASIALCGLGVYNQNMLYKNRAQAVVNKDSFEYAVDAVNDVIYVKFIDDKEVERVFMLEDSIFDDCINKGDKLEVAYRINDDNDGYVKLYINFIPFIIIYSEIIIGSTVYIIQSQKKQV